MKEEKTLRDAVYSALEACGNTLERDEEIVAKFEMAGHSITADLAIDYVWSAPTRDCDGYKMYTAEVVRFHAIEKSTGEGFYCDLTGNPEEEDCECSEGMTRITNLLRNYKYSEV
jgi:hypothetical protein